MDNFGVPGLIRFPQPRVTPIQSVTSCLFGRFNFAQVYSTCRPILPFDCRNYSRSFARHTFDCPSPNDRKIQIESAASPTLKYAQSGW